MWSLTKSAGVPDKGLLRAEVQSAWCQKSLRTDSPARFRLAAEVHPEGQAQPIERRASPLGKDGSAPEKMQDRKRPDMRPRLQGA